MNTVKAFRVIIAINIVVGCVATVLYLINGWKIAEFIAVIALLDTTLLTFNIYKNRKNDNQNDLEQ